MKRFYATGIIAAALFTTALHVVGFSLGNWEWWFPTLSAAAVPWLAIIGTTPHGRSNHTYSEIRNENQDTPKA